MLHSEAASLSQFSTSVLPPEHIQLFHTDLFAPVTTPPQ